MASAVHEACSKIIDNVNSSNLDYKMNQTPYSLHFSIRKKFTKISNSTTTDFGSLLNPQLSGNHIDLFRQELLNTRNEYLNLYNYYIEEKDAKNKLEAENLVLSGNLSAKHEHENSLKALKVEHINLQEKYENKCMEVMQLKTQIDDLNKDKNTFSVRLKTSKKENHEQIKDFENKKIGFEKKISELNEFRNKKLAEEREQKLLKQKELKRLKKKNKIDSDKSDGKKSFINKLSSYKDTFDDGKETKPDDDGKETKPEDVENDSKLDDNFNEVKEEPGEPVTEDDEEFIGPKLPPLMTREEIDAFKEELLTKYKLW